MSANRKYLKVFINNEHLITCGGPDIVLSTFSLIGITPDGVPNIYVTGLKRLDNKEMENNEWVRKLLTNGDVVRVAVIENNEIESENLNVAQNIVIGDQEKRKKVEGWEHITFQLEMENSQRIISSISGQSTLQLEIISHISKEKSQIQLTSFMGNSYDSTDNQSSMSMELGVGQWVEIEITK